MASVAHVLITMDRSPERNYLEDTLRSLDRSASKPVTLMICDTDCKGWADSEIERLHSELPNLIMLSVSDTRKLTANENAAQAFRAGALTGADWVLFMEDDIDVCNDYFESVSHWLDDHDNPNYRLCAFGADYTYSASTYEKGATAWEYPIEDFYGTQSVAVRNEDARTIAELVENSTITVEQTLPSGKINRVQTSGYDLLISSHWLREYYPDHDKFLASSPSFVQHVGMRSSLLPDRAVHTFPSWPGPRWTYGDTFGKDVHLRIDTSTPLRILWVGDAAVETGFAKCTHTVCDHLHERGWDVHILGINYHGDPHDYPYKIYPCYNPIKGGRDAFGVYRLQHMIDDIEPDMVVLLNDPWNIPNYMAALEHAATVTGKLTPPAIGWLAVDAENQPKGAVNGLHHVVTWTQFAADELIRSGYEGSTSVVPLGVDSEYFTPSPQDEARGKLSLGNRSFAADDFVIGTIGRNQYRKRFDLTIEYFARFVEQYDAENAKLLIHTAPTGEDAFDLDRLIDYYGVEDQVIISKGILGNGLDTRQLSVLYSSMDVFLTTTQGEGWGLCVLEAMACGVPCVIPDWSGLGDWAWDSALTVPCTSTAITAPRNAPGYTVGGVPDKAQTVRAIGALYREPLLREDYRERGLKKACTHTWKRTAWEFREALERIAGGS